MTTENEVQTEVETIATEDTPENLSLPSEETSDDDRFEKPDFSAITDFVEDDGEEATPPVEPVAEEVELAPEDETPPVEEAPPVEEVSETPEVVVEEPPVEEVPAQEQEAAPVEDAPPEPVQVPTKEELQGLYQEHRAKTLPELEKIFVLTDEEAAALDEQPSKILPKLAAQLQYDTMLSSYNAVLSALPAVIGTYLQTKNMADTAETSFFEVWPGLNTPKATPAVLSAVKAYRTANPRAPLEEVIKQSGVMAMINLGMDPNPPAVKPVVQAKPKVIPARPAAPGGSTQVAPPAREVEENVFSELAEVFNDEFN